MAGQSLAVESEGIVPMRAPEVPPSALIRPPIILDEHGDVYLFPTVEEAEQYLEPVDVRNNEYVAYDSEGRRLTLTVRTRQRPFVIGLLTGRLEHVAIGCEEEAPRYARELRAVLVDSLQRHGLSIDGNDHRSLRDLVKASLDQVGPG